MKVLLTGAAGGIGSTLGAHLYEAGHDLTLIDNFRNGYLSNLLYKNRFYGNFINKSINDPTINDDIDEGYDCLIHLAAVTSLPDCQINATDAFDTNVSGTAAMLEIARNKNIPKVIFASTSAVYENNKESLFTEELNLNPSLNYSSSKYMAENICNSYRDLYDMQITILRFFNVFGPRQDINRKNPPLLNYLVREIVNDRTPYLHSDGNQARDYVYVEDVIKLIEICLLKKANSTYNVCTGQLISVKDIVGYASEAFNYQIKPIYRDASMLWNTYPELFKGHFPLKKAVVSQETNKFSLGSNKKAQKELSWEPKINLKELFINVINQIRSNY
tara:strand:- start:21241 stop:22236 length:996 start_codon:yes stop_codon:yes gene_type:complete